MPRDYIDLFYVIAAVLFILGLKGLASPRTAMRGNLLGSSGMLLAIVVTLLDKRIISFEVIVAGLVLGALIGVVLAYRVPMTGVPQLVAIFNGFGGYSRERLMHSAELPGDKAEQQHADVKHAKGGEDDHPQEAH
mgnify:CR=1 FL=1